jgi:acyl transferase domain-containing protein
VILEDFETYQFLAGNALSRRPQRQIEQQGEIPRSRIFMLSGKDEQATVTLASNLIEHLKTKQYDSEEQFLDNLAFTIGQRRSKFAWVNAQPATTVAELIKKLEISKSTPKKTSEKPRTGFVFTGQGAQWWAMGRELIEAYPVFKNVILAAEKHLKEFGSTWNIIGKG